MKFLTLDDIKAQCRIESDFTLEDGLLTRYGNAAENTLLRMCNRSLQNLIDEYGEEGETPEEKIVPSDFYLAALMLVKHLYEHHGPTQNVPVSMVPYTLDMLIKPFMQLTSEGEV